MRKVEVGDKMRNQDIQYDIMHGNQKVAELNRNGTCHVYDENMMPYNLYLEQPDNEDIDIRLQNLDNFYHWCASRMLTLDREYAKEILNSINVSQSATDKDRAQVALSYHCLSLMDVYWVKESEEQVDFSQLNLFENHLSSAFVDVSLRGKQMTIDNSHLIAEDLSTQGCFPKAWVRREDGFYLLKDGGIDAVESELLASKICRCFSVSQVKYEEEWYDGQKVSVSRILTSLDHSIVPVEYFDVYCHNQEIDRMEYILKLDGYSYYMMNIIDYLVGNTDRHWSNWGLLVDNETNKPLRLYDLMDFNRAFQSYDTLEGAGCLTTAGKMSQRQAAQEAVLRIGLPQTSGIKAEWFAEESIREMFFQRLEVLQTLIDKSTV